MDNNKQPIGYFSFIDHDTKKETKYAVALDVSEYDPQKAVDAVLKDPISKNQTFQLNNLFILLRGEMRNQLKLAVWKVNE